MPWGARSKPIIPQPRPGPGETTPYLIKPGAMEFENAATGMRAKLTFLVEDVFGAGPRVLIAALQAPEIPRLGDAFEGMETLLVTSCFVTNVEDCNTKWEVTVTYGYPAVAGGPFDEEPPGDDAHPTLEFDSTVVMKQTNIAINNDPDATGPDAEGNLVGISVGDPVPMEIRNYHGALYDERKTIPIWDEPTQQHIDVPNPNYGVRTGTKAVGELPQGGMAEVPVPMTILRFMRREYPIDSMNRSIAFKAKAFVGKTNSVALGTGPYEDKPNTWLCTRIGAVTKDGGLTYDMTYEFLFDPERHRATIVWVDPTTGQPGDNLSILNPVAISGNGVKTYQVLGEIDFHTLNLYL